MSFAIFNGLSFSGDDGWPVRAIFIASYSIFMLNTQFL